MLDEAHYYLHEDAHDLLDFDRNGYTVITYCASSLPSSLLEATEVMIVTCQSNPAELEALRRHCARCKTVDVTRWSMLGHLKLGQAVALPLTEESGGELRLFTVAPRLTPHVRHREKYVDVPVSPQQAFIFARNDQRTEHRSRTLRQFVGELEHTSDGMLDGYLVRGDFSRWIDGVFGDHTLAEELRRLEERHRTASRTDTLAEIVAAIRARYDLADGEVAADVH